MKNGVAKLFGQIQRFVQINLTGLTDRVVGLLGGIDLLIITYFNKTVGQTEDPEIIREQSIIEMQEDRIQLRQAVTRASATQKRIHLQYNQVQSGANSAHEMATILKAQLDEQTALVDNLNRQLIALDIKISEAKTKKDLLKTQSMIAKANEQIHNTISRLDDSRIKLAFQVMEENVLRREAYLADRMMLLQFLYPPREEALATKLQNQTAHKIKETILQIDVRLPARLQAIAILICWKEELNNGKFKLLYRLILEQQKDLASLDQLIRQLRQVDDSALFYQAIEMIVAQKFNQLHYRQIQRVAIRCQERAKLAVQKGDEDWARELLIRKNSVIKIASILKAKLDKQTVLMEEIKLDLKKFENQIFNDKQTPLVEEIKIKLKKIKPKVKKFMILYYRFIESLNTGV
ncbi:MAG: PspA/IM30 family protein [Coleofasciculus sp. G1-WW12-02]|uniref:PspA/IM30 family protein n=1 Tax=Coleofasciculus sp. G1-WW12-02 TaxID=3068483 RepID=UPI0032F30843